MSVVVALTRKSKLNLLIFYEMVNVNFRKFLKGPTMKTKTLYMKVVPSETDNIFVII